MSVIVSLSPWSSFWTMGPGGGTSSDYVAVECLKRLGRDVLHFVEQGQPCDTGNIPIDARLGDARPWQRKLGRCGAIRHLGFAGRWYAFAIRAQAWRRHNEVFYRRVSEELRQRVVTKVDLVYCHSGALVQCGRQLARKYGCPVVAHFYGTFLQECIGARQAYWRHPEEYLGWTTLVDLRICNDDGTGGLEVARDLGLPLERFLFQPHGLDLAALNRQNEIDVSQHLLPGALHVMTASRLASWKRIDRLLQAVPEVVARFSGVRFLVIGDGPERQRLVDLAGELGVQEHVAFVGGVSRDTVFTFMRQCGIFVSCSDYTNVGRPLKEAMFLGMACVAVDSGDTKTLVADGVTGRLVAPDDTLGLSNALSGLLSDEAGCHRLGQAAKAFIEVHEPTEDAVVAERLTALQNLIGAYSRDGADERSARAAGAKRRI